MQIKRVDDNEITRYYWNGTFDIGNITGDTDPVSQLKIFKKAVQLSRLQGQQF